jgi:hypothetical protein
VLSLFIGLFHSRTKSEIGIITYYAIVFFSFSTIRLRRLLKNKNAIISWGVISRPLGHVILSLSEESHPTEKDPLLTFRDDNTPLLAAGLFYLSHKIG